MELAALKDEGKLKKLLVTGCLSQRYQKELVEELPEVDGVLGTGSYTEIVSALEEVMAGGRPFRFGDIDHTQEGVARLAHQGHHLFGIHQVLGAAKRYECNLQNRNSPLIFGILQAQQAVGGALKKAGQLHQLFNGR